MTQEIDEKRADTIFAALAIGHAGLVFINAYFRQQVNSLYSMSDYPFPALFCHDSANGCRGAFSLKGRRYGLILLWV